MPISLSLISHRLLNMPAINIFQSYYMQKHNQHYMVARYIYILQLLQERVTHLSLILMEKYTTCCLQKMIILNMESYQLLLCLSAIPANIGNPYQRAYLQKYLHPLKNILYQTRLARMIYSSKHPFFS